MNYKNAVKACALTLMAASLIALPQIGYTNPKDVCIPWRVYGPSSATAGSTITASVELTDVVTSDTTVYLTGSNFSSMPSYVTVHAGNSMSDDFYPTISSSATGQAGITASCNGGSVSGNVRINQYSPPPIPPTR